MPTLRGLGHYSSSTDLVTLNMLGVFDSDLKELFTGGKEYKSEEYSGVANGLYFPLVKTPQRAIDLHYVLSLSDYWIQTTNYYDLWPLFYLPATDGVPGLMQIIRSYPFWYKGFEEQTYVNIMRDRVFQQPVNSASSLEENETSLSHSFPERYGNKPGFDWSILK